MLEITLPGRGRTLILKHLLIDLNGTLTNAGKLDELVKSQIIKLKEKLEIYLLTADTYGTAKLISEELGIKLIEVDAINGGQDKRLFLHQLNAQEAVAIGNGFNDIEMLAEANLSIVIMGQEGCALPALLQADIAVTNIKDALDLLLNPERIIATLRA
ncbi:MAG: HAD family hydrolase [Syntrophomonadaceae bacterium]|nr:HAD family hydrolase [Syntrophomonadaceae bacterium]